MSNGNMVWGYDSETDTERLVPVKTALRESLSELSRSTLNAVRSALVEEKYICVGNWANCSLDENKPVGCLFAAAWMHTEDFLNTVEEYNGSIKDVFHNFDENEDQLYTVSDAFGDSSGDIGSVIEYFDNWGMQKSKHRHITYTWKDQWGVQREASEDVLTSSARKELIEMIDSILASRPALVTA